MNRYRYGNLIHFRSGTSIPTRCNNSIILRSGNPVAFRSGTTISFRPGLKLAKVQPDLNPINTRGSMQSRPDRACRSDSDPVYLIRSRYGNLIRFRSGAPIYTTCDNQIILRSGDLIVFRSDNSIVFRSGTTISFRPGLKLAKVQPDLNPIKTRGSMQSRPRSGMRIRFWSGFHDQIHIWQPYLFQIRHPNLYQM